MKILKGDEVFYYCHNEEGNLEGMISSHIDYFVLADTKKFMEEITMKIKKHTYYNDMVSQSLYKNVHSLNHAKNAFF